ncbi:WbqC family protein [Ichthyenterobacterium sp. W332]|uniref:WbqC family protein n=1 Tax=Microcosmobacter mediterraneus TaxID=3075607 RepID=A0ABU2YHN1_9FLAO|nr:WbqC family protein [Ichthyenterobacterium sp. W332]MDT0557204.1 WbqC family protein [Ichthyenterobacterium sp. W332]
MGFWIVMKSILHLAYFPNIAHFTALVQGKSSVFEVCDNYTKQTYRNRTCIYGANGKLQLNIPVNHTQKERQLYKDVKIANDYKWQIQHFKSLESAYKTSPFFEYYEDELKPLFEVKIEYLMDFNFKCLETIIECLQLSLNYTKTKQYNTSANTVQDFRPLVQCKKEIPQQFETYTQVFDAKYGFIPNLSIIDLLCNEGPNTLTYLERQSVNLVKF